MPDAATADRLTLVSGIAPFGSGAQKFLSYPVWIKPGQRYWYDDEQSALVVQSVDGSTVSHPCAYATGPLAVR